jgi:hypothetical protein
MAKAKWELKMKQARDLKKQGSEILFDRVSLLVACYNDSDFRAWAADQGTNELDFLDEELSDTAASFLTLKAVLDAYPEKESWTKHNVRDLIAQVLSDEKKKRDRDDAKRVSWKERALAAEQECERLRGELENMKESLGIVASAKCVN